MIKGRLWKMVTRPVICNVDSKNPGFIIIGALFSIRVDPCNPPNGGRLEDPGTAAWIAAAHCELKRWYFPPTVFSRAGQRLRFELFYINFELLTELE